MIYEKLLHGCIWQGNTILLSSEKEAKIMHKFLREAILDSHLYVTKAIGFAISAAEMRSQHDTYISRHNQMGDSYVEMMTNLQDKVFLNVKETELSMLLQPGACCVQNGTINCVHNTVKTLATSPYICRNLSKECILKLRLSTSCGYRDLAGNSKLLDEEYFPMYTYFNIADYVRVLPRQEGFNQIYLRFYHGFTVDDFRTILQNNYDLYTQHNVKRREEKWVQTFDL